jgi:hypothetical protein
MPTLESFVARVVSVEHIDFLVTYVASALFAAIVFVVSVVSVPMMLDRGTDTIVAALTSVRALFANPLPLLLWALLSWSSLRRVCDLLRRTDRSAPVIGHVTGMPTDPRCRGTRSCGSHEHRRPYSCRSAEVHARPRTSAASVPIRSLPQERRNVIAVAAAVIER